MSDLVRFQSADTERIPISLQAALPGVQSGAIFQDASVGITIKQTSIAPNGSVPGHKATGIVAYQVIEGSGTIYVEDDSGAVLQEVSLCAGDIKLSYPPHYNHRYVAGKNGLVYTLFAFTPNK